MLKSVCDLGFGSSCSLHEKEYRYVVPYLFRLFVLLVLLFLVLFHESLDVGGFDGRADARAQLTVANKRMDLLTLFMPMVLGDQLDHDRIRNDRWQTLTAGSWHGVL